MKTSMAGVNAIKQFEGLRVKTYRDIAGKLTIGYGHLVKEGDGIVEGEIISVVEATAFLVRDLEWAEQCITKNVHTQLTQNEFDALVSFVYNVGCPNFSHSTMLLYLNNGNKNAAGQEFVKWKFAGGVNSPGLLARREKERDIFLKGVY
jgi:lysozyme